MTSQFFVWEMTFLHCLEEIKEIALGGTNLGIMYNLLFRIDCSYMTKVYTIKEYMYTITKLSKIEEKLLYVKIFRTKFSLQSWLAKNDFSFIDFLKEFTKLHKKKSPYSIKFILFIKEKKRDIHHFGTLLMIIYFPCVGLLRGGLNQ